jgi:glycosyltransferase involved in cell wall biosynthesis
MLTNFRIGGTERQVTNLVLRIDPTRFELHLASLSQSGELLRELEALPIPRPEFRISRLYGLKTFHQTARLAAYIREHNIQIVHSYGFYSNVFAIPAARLAGAKVIASIRDTCEILTPWQRRVQKGICRLADYILVNAAAIRRALIDQGYKADRIRLIPNGVVAFGETRNGAGLRAELGVPPSARIVLVSSRLNRMKGLPFFLEAAAVVAARLPDVYFVIAGDGAERKKLEEYAVDLGIGRRVLFAGFRTDVPDLLSQAALSVLPSLSEGLSNSLLESMAAGVPVVATRVGGNPEVVDDGVTGLLAPPRDSIALAHAMLDLLDNPDLAARFGAAGKQRIARLFSVERAVRETERLYTGLVESGAI